MVNSALKRYFGHVSEFDRQESAGLYAFVEECAKKLGITDPVTLVRTKSKIASLHALPEKSVNGKGQNSIIISDGALELFSSTNLRGHFSDELKAAVAHEMSHIKDGYWGLVKVRILPVFALPVAFATGYYVLDKASHLRNKDKSLSLPDAIKKVVIGEKKSVKASEDFNQKDPIAKKADLYDYWLRLGGTVASAAIGLAAGMGLGRHLMLKTEFRADRTGALLVNPDAMASALQKITDQMEQSLSRKICFKPPFITTSPDVDTALYNLGQRLKAYYQQEKILYHLEVANAHPTLAQRTAALRELKQSADFRTRLTSNPEAPGGGIIL